MTPIPSRNPAVAIDSPSSSPVAQRIGPPPRIPNRPPTGDCGSSAGAASRSGRTGGLIAWNSPSTMQPTATRYRPTETERRAVEPVSSPSTSETRTVSTTTTAKITPIRRSPARSSARVIGSGRCSRARQTQVGQRPALERVVAGRQVVLVAVLRLQLRLVDVADALLEARAARVEAARGRRIDRAGPVALEPHGPPLARDHGIWHR